MGGCDGCPVAVASGHGEAGRRVAAAACQRLGVRQRTGAGGRQRAHGLVCVRVAASRPAAQQVRLGLCAGVATYSAAGGTAPVPGTVLALILASGLAFAALGLPPDILGIAILVAVYSVAAYGSRWVSLAGLAAAELGLAAVQLTPSRIGVDTLVGNLGVVAAAWLLGLVCRQLPGLCRHAGAADGRTGAGPGGAGPPGGDRGTPAPCPRAP